MDESAKQFSFTRAALSRSGRVKNQIPISLTNAPAGDFEGDPRGIPDIGYDELLFPPLLLSPVVLDDERLRIIIAGEPGSPFLLEGTSDLFNWTDLGAYTNETRTLMFHLPVAPPISTAQSSCRLPIANLVARTNNLVYPGSVTSAPSATQQRYES
jgi:hypothetical protein